MDEKIKEIEDRLEEGNWRQREDIKYLISYIKELESELSKWTASHEDNDLQWLKEQSNQISFSAKRAYINGLEHKVKHLEARIKELGEGIGLIDRECSLCAPFNTLPDRVQGLCHKLEEKK